MVQRWKVWILLCRSYNPDPCVANSTGNVVRLKQINLNHLGEAREVTLSRLSCSPSHRCRLAHGSPFVREAVVGLATEHGCRHP